jgi:acyl-CoA synthetase (AMP-forming)/AMP-acid ligase II
VNEGVEAQISALDDAWSAAPSVLVGGATGHGVVPFPADLTAVLPPALHRGHFALLTSGSTGTPRVVVGDRARTERLVEVLHEVQRSEAVRETVLALPVTYSYALVNQWVWARRFGRRLVVTEGFADPVRLRRALDAADDAMICLVGVHVPLLERYFAGVVFPGVVRVHFAGGRFPQEALPFLARMFPRAEVFNNYGCAEALPRLTVRAAGDADRAADIGRPLPGVELRSDDDGSLRFRSPYRAVGVVDDGSWQPFADEDWVPTGDLGHAEPNGHWVLDGRASEVFKRHGEKVSVPEVLTTVFAHWSGQASAYREADRTGEDGFVLVLAPKADDAAVRGILAALRRAHPRAAWPLRIEGADRLPELATGKIDVQRLASLDGRETLWHQRI